MIHYYFGEKEGLYCKVLEGVFASLRNGEDKLNRSIIDMHAEVFERGKADDP